MRLVVDDRIPRDSWRASEVAEILEAAAGWRDLTPPAGEAHLYVLYVLYVPYAERGIGFHAPLLPILVIGRANVRQAAWGWIAEDAVERLVLAHELGHALGLVDDDGHEAAGSHCTDPGCVMYRHPVDLRKALAAPFRFLVGRLPTGFCSDCRDELDRSRARPVPFEVDFDGRGAVRSMGAYTVRIGLSPGDTEIEAPGGWSAATCGQALEDPSVMVRLFAGAIAFDRALGSAGHARLLAAFLRDEPVGLVRAAVLEHAASRVEALVESGGEILFDPALEERFVERLTADPEEDVRRAVCDVAANLFTRGPPAGLDRWRDVLRRAASSDESSFVRADAVEALVAGGDPRDDAFLAERLREDPEDWVRSHTAEALRGTLSAQRLGDALREAAVRDPEPWVRSYALRAVDGLGDPADVELLRDRRANDPDPGVREVAADRLEAR